MNLTHLHSLGFDRSAKDRHSIRQLSVKCSQCEALVINGTPTHETRCPNTPVECRECGQLYTSRQEAAACCAPCEDDFAGEED